MTVTAVKSMGRGMVERHGARPGRGIDQPAFTVRASAGGTEPGGFKWQIDEEEDSMDNVADMAEWTGRRPATTVVGSFRPDVISAPGYRTAGGVSRQDQPGSVRITVEEAAVLQSYPPDFPFQGSKGKKFLQIGNACPPLLMRRIFEELWSEPEDAGAAA